MYEIEIALLRGNVAERFGPEFLQEVEELHSFFTKQEIDPRRYVLDVWELLKNDAKAKRQIRVNRWNGCMTMFWRPGFSRSLARRRLISV